MGTSTPEKLTVASSQGSGAGADRPRIVSWNVTAACHLKCGHCYLAANKRWPNELTTSEGLALIDEMVECGTELLILTGGEPLLRGDILTLARHATSGGIKVVLGTTGTTIDRRKASELRESGIMAAGISLDSTDPAKHDRFRGLPGAWRRAVEGIDSCIAEGIQVLVHTTALKMNQNELPALVEFAHQKEATAFQLFFLVCTGRGEQLTDLAPAEYRKALEFLLRAQHSYPGMIVRARCAPYFGRMVMEQGTEVGIGAACLAGVNYCRVTPSGQITPCPYLPLVAGDFREHGFKRTWDSASALSQFRSPNLQLRGKCGECALSRGPNPICVGCRARAFALAGDPQEADPWCFYEPATGPDSQGLVDETAVEGRSRITWSEEAEQRLGRVPAFLRERVKASAESSARRRGLLQVTAELLSDLRARRGGSPYEPETGKSRGARARTLRHLLSPKGKQGP